MIALPLLAVLSNDERIIVLSNRETDQVYTWNQSLTLQCWTVGEDGSLTEVDIRTLSNVPRGYRNARKAAIQWLHDNNIANAEDVDT